MSERKNVITVKNVKVGNYNVSGPLRDVKFGRYASFNIDINSEQDKDLRNKFKAISDFVVESYATDGIDVSVGVVLKARENKKSGTKFKELRFPFKTLSENKTKTVIENIAKEYEDNGDLETSEELKDMLPLEGGAFKALLQEVKKLKDLGMEDKANELQESCLVLNQLYVKDKKFVLPPIVEMKDGVYTSTFTSAKDGLEKPLYVSYNDTVNITFRVIPTENMKDTSKIILKLELLGVEIVKRAKEFTQSNYVEAKTIDISGLDIEDDTDSIDFSKFTSKIEALPKTVKPEVDTPKEETTSVKTKKADIESVTPEKPKKTSKKKEVVEEETTDDDEITLDDIDAMLSEE